MALNWKAWMAALGCAAWASLVPAENSIAQLQARVAQLEQLVAEQQSSMHYASYGGDEEAEASHTACGDCGDCDSCCNRKFVGQDFYNTHCRPCTVQGGYEVIFLRPYFSEDFLTNPTADMGFDPSWRFWVGRQFSNGLGTRVRYWEIDRGVTNGAQSIGVEFRTIDAEATQAVTFAHWTFVFAGGVRYGESHANNGGTNVGFDGAGLTVAAEAYRELLGMSNLQWYTKARWSALYGNKKFGGNSFDRDDMVQIMELGIGPQWNRYMGSSTLTIGGGLEAQYWSNAMFDTQDFGFFGFAASIAFAR